MADSDAVVVSEAAAREAGSSEGRDAGYGRTAPREARYLSAAAGWELRAPGAGQEGAGQVRAERVCVHVGSCGAAAPASGISPFGNGPAPGAPERSGALSLHSSHVPEDRPGGRDSGSVCAWRGACRPPPPALLPRWAATLNLIRSQEPGDHQRLRPGGKAGFCFAVT